MDLQCAEIFHGGFVRDVVCGRAGGHWVRLSVAVAGVRLHTYAQIHIRIHVDICVYKCVSCAVLCRRRAC